MAFWKIKSGAHDAKINDYRKVSNERMVARLASIKSSIKGVPPAKRAKLEAEAKAILADLGARDEALDKIVKDLVGDEE
jgi:hypothetical protein